MSKRPRLRHPSTFIKYEGDVTPKTYTEEERRAILKAALPDWNPRVEMDT